ncbi:2716_t:CDS:1, partial [Racocetra persica]
GEENVGGYNWSSGTKFWVDNQTLSNNPDFWNDPEIFNPDRFLSKSGATSEVLRKSYAPFDDGLRICPGRFLATNLAKTLTVLFYRKYDIKLVNFNEKIKYHRSTSNR